MAAASVKSGPLSCDSGLCCKVADGCSPQEPRSRLGLVMSPLMRQSVSNTDWQSHLAALGCWPWGSCESISQVWNASPGCRHGACPEFNKETETQRKCMEETVEDWLWGFKKHPPPFISEPLRCRWKNVAEARLSPWLLIKPLGEFAFDWLESRLTSALTYLITVSAGPQQAILRAEIPNMHSVLRI